MPEIQNYALLERVAEAAQKARHEADLLRAVIDHIASGRCQCDPSVGAVPCEVCAMGMVKRWSRKIDDALDALASAPTATVEDVRKAVIAASKDSARVGGLIYTPPGGPWRLRGAVVCAMTDAALARIGWKDAPADAEEGQP